MGMGDEGWGWGIDRWDGLGWIGIGGVGGVRVRAGLSGGQ